MSRLLSSSKYTNIILALVGFFLFSFFVTDMNASRQMTIPYRILSLFFAVFIITKSIKSQVSVNKILLIFWGLYAVRLFYDLFIINKPIIGNVSNKEWEFVAYAIGTCFIPMLSMHYTKSVNFYSLGKIMIIILTILILYSILLNSENLVDDSENKRLDGNVILNSISYGHYSVSLFAISLFFLIKNKSFLYIIPLILGLYVMLVAGSRGPLIATIVIFVVVAIFFASRGLKNALITILIGFVVVVGIDVIMSFFLHNFQTMYSRIIGDNVYYVGSGRDNLFLEALKLFLDNPITGSDFLLRKDDVLYYFPHNLPIEAFMACGILGGGTFLYLYLKGIYWATKGFFSQHDGAWICLLFLQQAVGVLFSGTLWNASPFWCLLVLVSVVNQKYQKIR